MVFNCKLYEILSSSNNVLMSFYIIELWARVLIFISKVYGYIDISSLNWNMTPYTHSILMTLICVEMIFIPGMWTFWYFWNLNSLSNILILNVVNLLWLCGLWPCFVLIIWWWWGYNPSDAVVGSHRLASRGGMEDPLPCLLQVARRTLIGWYIKILESRYRTSGSTLRTCAATSIEHGYTSVLETPYAWFFLLFVLVGKILCICDQYIS